ncbi:hypothetical protein D3C84_641290 [compost metagenome]
MGLIVAAAIGLQQHDGHAGDLAHQAATAGFGGFGWVEAFVPFAAQQFPQQGEQGGFASTGFARGFEERERLVPSADLLGEQRTEPEGQRHGALGAKALPEQVQPLRVVVFGVLLQGDLYAFLQALELQFAHLEELLFVDGDELAFPDGDVVEHVAAVLPAVANVVDGLNGFDTEKLVFHDFVQLLSTPGEHGPGTHAEKSFLEFAGCCDLATGEGVFHRAAVMGKVDAEEVPGLVGDLVALEIQGLGVAVGDLDHAAGHAQRLGTACFVVELLVFMVVAGVQCLHRAVELRNVQLPPVQAGVEAEVELLSLTPLVHEQGFFHGALGDQQGTVVLGVLQLLVDPLSAGFDVVHERPTLVQIVPIDLA